MAFGRRSKDTDGDQGSRTAARSAAAGTDEETETSPAQEQHPALAGDPALEVEQRSADGSQGMTWRKVFVLTGSVDEDHPTHDDNAVRTLEEAIQRGLHPKGEARLVDLEHSDPDRRGTVLTTCTYEVDVEPAVTDHRANETVTVSSAIEERQRTWTGSDQ